MVSGSTSRSQAVRVSAIPSSSRVEHLLAVARSEFSAHGYQHVSIDGISRASGVSKETIYRHFANKNALFEAAVDGQRDAFLGSIAKFSAEPASDRAVADFAFALHGAVRESGYILGTWLTIAQAKTFPVLAARLRGESLSRLEPVRAALEARVRADGGTGRLSLDSAGDLGSMAVQGTRHLMGWPPLADDLARAHAAAVADLFLYGCTARGDGPSAPTPSEPSDREIPDAYAPPAGDHIATLMEVARRHFYESGYEGASLELIGAEARVGRGTLYRHFAGKAGLFEAVMTDAAHDVAAAIKSALRSPPLAGEAQDVLHVYAKAALRIFSAPVTLDLQRTVIAEAKRSPRLARQVSTTIFHGLMAPLATYLSQGARDGRFRLTDPDWHARQFLILATEGARPLTFTPRYDGHARERIAKRAIATFLHGVPATLV